jgi:SAM-dependent methyltransferase
VAGVDQRPAMLAVARAKLAGRSGAVLALGELERLPVGDGAVDLTVCALALTQLADPTGALLELRRVTRPGGRVIVSDVHPLMASLGYHAFVPPGRRRDQGAGPQPRAPARSPCGRVQAGGSEHPRPPGAMLDRDAGGPTALGRPGAARGPTGTGSSHIHRLSKDISCATIARGEAQARR